MKRSINQAVYKFLPQTWVSERTSYNAPITAKITKWNIKEMDGIYTSFIESEIRRQVKLFGERQGDISSYDINNDASSFLIAEAVRNEGIEDIFGEISPLVFYCSKCGKAREEANSDEISKHPLKCEHQTCGTSILKQLQMIYTCECGYAEPITIPKVYGIKEYIYRPNETSYKMFYKKDGVERTAEFRKNCPNCSSVLLPDNANSGANYKPFTLRLINLVSDKSGLFYEKGIDAQKVIAALWFGKLSKEDFDFIVNNQELAFSDMLRSDSLRKEAEQQASMLLAAGLIGKEIYQDTVAKLMEGKTNPHSVETYINAIDTMFAEKKNRNLVGYNEWLTNLSFKLMQYNTLKYANSVITMDDIINHLKAIKMIDNENEILKLNKKLGIANVQVTCDTQILNCTYGYTRKASDPKLNQNKKCLLKLNAFDKYKNTNRNIVYSSKLDTEGILFEFDQRKIIEWLFENSIIDASNVPDLDDSNSIKRWFAEYVHSEVISIFGDIDESERITKHIFALLHSISHAFINIAGEISGLDSNSLSEIIIVETASVFIYSQSSQGIPLGALSGMAESNYKLFLNRVYEESRNCVFDPICTRRDDTKCSACLVLPEISCNHFNAELGRKYMYTLPNVENIIKGFWEM